MPLAIPALREPALATFSACRLCVHSAETGLELACAHPELLNPFAGPQPVAILRAAGSACGPNAARMAPRYLQTEARPL